MKKFVALAVAFLSASASFSQTWQTMTNPPSFRAGTPLLLTDGTVMVQEAYTSNWWKLTPSTRGSYVGGKWSKLASSGWAPTYYASAVLKDGRVFVMGGEYDFGYWTESNLGAIYDPVANTWTPLPAPPTDSTGTSTWPRVGDAQSVVLPDGRLMLANIYSSQTAILDPTTLTWTLSGNGKADQNSEEGWSLLPDGTVLTVDCWSPNNSERYIPSLDQWISAGSTPVTLVDTGSKEIGPQLLMPNGKVYALGATMHTSIYTPSLDTTGTGSWKAGPDIPSSLDVADGAAVALPNGHMFFGASPGIYKTGSSFFDFDGTTMTAMPNPANASYSSSYYYSMLLLPNGQVLVTNQSEAYIFVPTGSPKSAWKPTVSAWPSTITAGATNYSVNGTQFNGLTQGAAYGDDVQNATNYPLVRITNLATGNVAYCRTHDHSTMAVATGSTPTSTLFDVPLMIDSGPSVLQVIANGIASAKMPLNVVSFNLRSLSPGWVLVGTTGIQVTVKGNGFDSTSTVTLDGTAESTTFTDVHTLEVTLPDSLATTAGHHALVVQNGNGAVTGSLDFQIRNPQAVLTSFTPVRLPADGAKHLIQIFGSNFLPNSKIYLGYTHPKTIYVSPTEIDCYIPASMTTIDTAYYLAVTNPGPGGGGTGSGYVIVGEVGG